ncbi:hypothetical protein GGH92_006658, partial [Coemansia sp. RSA 2673]
MSGIASGVAQKLLVDYFGRIKCFPLTSKLKFAISDYKSPSIDATDVALSNALEFAERLKSMVPAATTIDV